MDKTQMADIPKKNGQHPPAGVDLAKTVLVTGAAGFLGRHLVKRLLAEDLTTCVIAIDNGSTGSIPDLVAQLDQRVQTVDRSPLRTAVVQGDIRDLKTWHGALGALSQFKFPPLREVYHLACPACPAAWATHPVDTLLTAVMGTHQAATFANTVVPHLYPELPKPRFVHLSSAAVYGTGVGVDEEDEAIVQLAGSPRSCYDEGKRAAEALLGDVVRIGGLDARVTRPATVYGPGMRPDDGRAVSSFIVAALTDQPLRVQGDGSFVVQLLHVDDAIDALLQLMALPANPGPLNLGHAGGTISLANLAAAVLGAVPASTSAVELTPDGRLWGPPELVFGRVGMAMPAWHVRRNLYDGLRETVADLKAQLDRKAEPKEASRILLPGGAA